MINRATILTLIFVSTFFQAKAEVEPHKFVGSLYFDVLNRDADGLGEYNFEQALISNALNPAQVVHQFVNFPEYPGRRIIDIFNRVLGRMPSTSEKNQGINCITGANTVPSAGFPTTFSVNNANPLVCNSTVLIEDLEAWVVASDEYKNGTTHVASHISNTAYVRGNGDNGIYGAILQRQPDNAGATALINALNAGMSRWAAAKSLSESAEYYTNKINWYYQVFLRRTPNPNELGAFVSALQHQSPSCTDPTGGVPCTQMTLIASILNGSEGPEYFNAVNNDPHITAPASSTLNTASGPISFQIDFNNLSPGGRNTWIHKGQFFIDSDSNPMTPPISQPTWSPAPTTYGANIDISPWADGQQHAIYFKGSDTAYDFTSHAAGLIRTSASVNFTLVDNTPPIVAMLNPPPPPSSAAQISGRSFQFQASASDNRQVSFVQFVIDNGALTLNSTVANGCNPAGNHACTFLSQNFDTTQLSASGQHTAVAVATDLAGNTATSVAATFTVANQIPPVITVSASPSSPAVVLPGTGPNLFFSASIVSNPQGDNISSITYFGCNPNNINTSTGVCLVPIFLASSASGGTFSASFTHTAGDGMSGFMNIYGVAASGSNQLSQSSVTAVQVFLDQAATLVSVSAPSSANWNSSVQVSLSANTLIGRSYTASYIDADSGTLLASGISAGPGNFFAQISLPNSLQAGTHHIYAVLKDDQNLSSSAGNPPFPSTPVTVVSPAPSISPLVVMATETQTVIPPNMIIDADPNPGNPIPVKSGAIASRSVTISGTATSQGAGIGSPISLYLDSATGSPVATVSSGGGTTTNGVYSVNFRFSYNFGSDAPSYLREDGSPHTFIVKVQDTQSPSLGASVNQSNPFQDFIPPKISQNSFNPANNSQGLNGTKTVLFTVVAGNAPIGAGSVSCMIDNISLGAISGCAIQRNATGTCSCSWDTQQVQGQIEGSHTFTVSGIDQQLLSVNTSVSYGVLDTTPPVVTYNTLSQQFQTELCGPFTVSAAVPADENIVVVQFYNDNNTQPIGFAVPSGSGSLLIATTTIAAPTFLDGSSHTLTAEAVDAGGFIRQATTPPITTLARRNPVPFFAAPSNGSSFANTNASNPSSPVNVDFIAGVYDVLPQSEVLFSLDPADGGASLADYTIQAQLQQSSGLYKATIDLHSAAPGGQPLSAGIHSMYVYAQDIVGNASLLPQPPLLFAVSDTAPPSLVAMTANYSQSQSNVALSVTANDSDDGVHTIQFMYNVGQSENVQNATGIMPIDSCNQAFSCQDQLNFATNSLASNLYIFFAKAIDASGNVGYSVGVPQFIQGQQAPVIVLTSSSFQNFGQMNVSPQVGVPNTNSQGHFAGFSGTATFQPGDLAPSNGGIQIFADGNTQNPLVRCTNSNVTSTSLSFSCNPADLTPFANNGVHTFFASVSSDALSNQSNLLAVQLFDQMPPQVQVVSPSPSTTPISGTITLIASASDLTGIKLVEFTVAPVVAGVAGSPSTVCLSNQGIASTNSSGQFIVTCNTSQLSAHQQFQFTATASDFAGNSGIASVILNH